MAITEADSRQAEQIVQSLGQIFHITIVKDWGQPETKSAAPQGWLGGEWSLKELLILQKGITDLADAMGDAVKFIHSIGAISISQVQTKYRGLATKQGIKFTASPVSIDTWTVVHELAHVWDAHTRWRLSKALETYTGGHTDWAAMLIRRARKECDEERRWPGCNRYGYFYGGPPPAGSDQNLNRKEDFAEAVAAYIYPELAQARVERFNDDARYREFLYYTNYTQSRRWAFVDGLMRGATVVE